MKKIIYVALTVLLGVLLGVLLQGILELVVLKIGSGRFVLYFLIHRFQLALGLIVLGAGAGWFFGLKFWQILYVEKRYGEPRI